MDIIKYSENVKTFKTSEVLLLTQSLEVGGNDLLGKLELLSVNDIDLSHPLQSWYITTSIEKALAAKGFRTSLFASMDFGARCILSINDGIKKMIHDYKEKVWDGKILTIKQANILNTIEKATFWIEYSNILLDVLITMSNDETSPEKYLTKFDLKQVNENKNVYEKITLTLMLGSRQFITDLNGLHDLPVEEDSIVILNETEGGGKIDLISQGFGIHLVTPLFWVSLMKSKVQLHRIEQMRRKNEYFAMKISKAINQKQGNDDPQLDRRIEIYQDEIIKNEATIARIEASYE